MTEGYPAIHTRRCDGESQGHGTARKEEQSLQGQVRVR